MLGCHDVEGLLWKVGSPMSKRAANTNSNPKFPYTTAPGVLRKALQAIPNKPKPAKLNSTTLISWGAAAADNGNTRSAATVLKQIGFAGSGGEPTPLYTEFMKRGEGPAALGAAVRQ